jgi:glc operon protein GlcG
MTAIRKMLSLDVAKGIAMAVEKKAIENNIHIVISIYDNHGNLKYFQRMDNTSYGSIRISQLKAKTAASMPISTNALAERSAKMSANPYSAIPDILLLGGGLPIITKDSQHIGAIGISGATPELDEVCAQAGLDAIAEDLV